MYLYYLRMHEKYIVYIELCPEVSSFVIYCEDCYRFACILHCLQLKCALGRDGVSTWSKLLTTGICGCVLLFTDM